MKRKMLIGMLVLAMSLSVTACGSSSSDSAADSATSANAETSKDAEKSVSQESSEAEVESESETDADQADMRNDLPVGYIADGGYYNSYFGFKFEASAEDELVVSQYYVAIMEGGYNNVDVSDIDPENYETVENALTSVLDSNGSARVYDLDEAFTDGNQTFGISVSVIKGTTLDDQIAEDKESIQEISYLSEATQGTVTIGGDTKECLTFVEYPNAPEDTSVETPVAYIYYDKDDYVCVIVIRNYSSLEDVCATFDAF